jgi:phosphoenolpyruvate phosphomutase
MRVLKFLPRFQEAYRAMRTLEAREGWSRAEIESFQLERLNDVWAHATAHVPYYRQMAKYESLPARFASLAEFTARVPVLPKVEVREHPRDFLSEQALRGHWTRTGGSTGTPMNCYWAKDAHCEMLRGKYRFQATWGVDIFDRTVFLWGHSASFKPGLPGWLARRRQPLEDRLRNRLRLSAYHLGRDDLRRHLRRIASFRPAFLYGYSRALALLAQEAEAVGFHCDSLKVAHLTAEPAEPHLVATVERVLGIPAVIEYGSSECGFIAGEAPDRTLRVREDLVYLEALPHENGRYDLVVTVLNNPSFPLLRYAIGDLTDAPLEVPERGFSRLRNVAGRNNDLVVTRTGRYLHSAHFEALFKYDTKVIRRFRVRQHADGALGVALEVNDPAVSFDTAGLQQKIRDLVEGYPVQVQVVKELPRTPAGKHRLVVSDLDIANRPMSVFAAKKKEHVHADVNGKEAAIPQAACTCTADDARPATKARKLRRLMESPELSFIMEAHNGLSAKVVEEAGFEAIWASGLSISAALGVRDSNEASWTQVLEVLEFMSDTACIPILVDGDTGYGNFNNMRRLVRKLEQRGIGGVCIEDKVFPKTNSFLNGTAQPLAEIDEFCGKIRAAKDAQHDADFVLVARVEAFIAGWGLQEALRRAEAYRQAGADAILIHSALRSANEILSFKEEWGDRLPVVIVPTKYYATPTNVFRKFGFSAVIWANHLMRSCITAMQHTAQEIFEEQSLVRVEERVAPLAEVFRLQGASELEEAEKRYLPKHVGHTRAIILAAGRGEEFGDTVGALPRYMVSIGGVPALERIVNTYRAAGIKDIAVVRGEGKETIKLNGVRFYDSEEAAETSEVQSLAAALPALEGQCIISLGDVLFKKYLAEELMDLEVDFAVAVDATWPENPCRSRQVNYVKCSEESARKSSCRPACLLDVSADLAAEEIHGEWIGFLKVSAEGARFLRILLARLAVDKGGLRSMDLGGLLREIIKAGKEVRVVYTAGHWMRLGRAEDVQAAGSFQ